jgi:hypothetical protein
VPRAVGRQARPRGRHTSWWCSLREGRGGGEEEEREEGEERRRRGKRGKRGREGEERDERRRKGKRGMRGGGEGREGERERGGEGERERGGGGEWVPEARSSLRREPTAIPKPATSPLAKAVEAWYIESNTSAEPTMILVLLPSILTMAGG